MFYGTSRVLGSALLWDICLGDWWLAPHTGKESMAGRLPPLSLPEFHHIPLDDLLGELAALTCNMGHESNRCTTS